MKQIKKTLIALMTAYIPSLLIIAALIGGEGSFFDTPFIFDLLIVLLYTLPLFIGVIEIVICIIRTIESKKRVSIYSIMKIFIAMSAIILIVLNKFIYVSVALAMLLLVFEMVHCVKEKSIINAFRFFKQISFWVIVFCVLLLVALCSGAYRFALNANAHVDPFAFKTNTYYYEITDL